MKNHTIPARVFISILMFTLFLSPGPDAQAAISGVIHGPHTFTRAKGKPVTQTIQVQCENPDAIHLLRIINGSGGAGFVPSGPNLKTTLFNYN